MVLAHFSPVESAATHSVWQLIILHSFLNALSHVRLEALQWHDLRL